MFCEKCGNKIVNGDKYCNKCGAKLQGELRAEVQERKSILPVLIALVSILVVVLGVIIGLLIYSSKGSQTDSKLALADCYLGELDYEKAIEAYKAALKLAPGNADVIAKIYDAYMDWAEAESDDSKDILDEAAEYYNELYEKADQKVAKTVKKYKDKIEEKAGKKKEDSVAENTPTEPAPTEAAPTAPAIQPEDEAPTPEDVTDDTVPGTIPKADVKEALAKLDAATRKKYRTTIEDCIEKNGIDPGYEPTCLLIYLDGDDVPEIAVCCSWWAYVFWYDGNVVEQAHGDPVCEMYYTPYESMILFDSSMPWYNGKLYGAVRMSVDKNGKDSLPGGMKGSFTYSALGDYENGKMYINKAEVSYEEYEKSHQDNITKVKEEMVLLRDEETDKKGMPLDEFLNELSP